MREMINGTGLFYVVGCQLKKHFTFMELLESTLKCWCLLLADMPDTLAS